VFDAARLCAASENLNAARMGGSLGTMACRVLAAASENLDMASQNLDAAKDDASNASEDLKEANDSLEEVKLKWEFEVTDKHEVDNSKIQAIKWEKSRTFAGISDTHEPDEL
jgi:uncharacterized Zn finger protein